MKSIISTFFYLKIYSEETTKDGVQIQKKNNKKINKGNKESIFETVKVCNGCAYNIQNDDNTLTRCKDCKNYYHKECAQKNMDENANFDITNYSCLRCQAKKPILGNLDFN